MMKEFKADKKTLEKAPLSYGITSLQLQSSHFVLGPIPNPFMHVCKCPPLDYLFVPGQAQINRPASSAAPISCSIVPTLKHC